MSAEKMEQLKDKILSTAENSKLPCQKAFAIAEETGLTRAEVGKACNELGVKIFDCQLGCF